MDENTESPQKSTSGIFPQQYLIWNLKSGLTPEGEGTGSSPPLTLGLHGNDLFLYNAEIGLPQDGTYP